MLDAWIDEYISRKYYQKVVLQEWQLIRFALFSFARIIMLQLGPGQNLNSGWDLT